MELQMQYEAVKNVKEGIVLSEIAERLTQAKTRSGLNGLSEVADLASEKQMALAKKMQEFAGDEETSLTLKAAETEMRLIQEELYRLAASPDVSVRETDSIKLLAKGAREQEAYNRLYAEALPIARGGDQMELDMYFEALEAQFQSVETDYNWAVAENKPEAAQLAIDFDKALSNYNAALDAQYDVVEAVQAEQLIPEVTLTEDEEEELSYPIKDARAKDGGNADIKTLLKRLFDGITRLETALGKDKEDRTTQDSLARARTVYEFSKGYAADTASKQEGAPVEEEAATGAYVKAEVEIDATEAADLEKEIAD